MVGTDESVIALRDLAKSYGSVRALDGLTLELPPGAVGLLGPNGAGKTTLIKLLLGLLRPDRGGARVAGLDPTDAYERLEVRRAVGYMPEGDCLVPGMTAVELVTTLGRLTGMTYRDAMTRAHEVLDYVELGRGALPRAGGVLHGDEAAPQAGPGAGARPRPAAAGRADQRAGPQGSPAHARPGARPGARAGQEHPGLLAPAAGRGAHLRRDRRAAPRARAAHGGHRRPDRQQRELGAGGGGGACGGVRGGAARAGPRARRRGRAGLPRRAVAGGRPNRTACSPWPRAPARRWTRLAPVRPTLEDVFLGFVDEAEAHR